MMDIVDRLNLKFQSGNGVPVSRATISADEWRELQEHLADLYNSETRMHFLQMRLTEFAGAIMSAKRTVKALDRDLLTEVKDVEDIQLDRYYLLVDKSNTNDWQLEQCCETRDHHKYFTVNRIWAMPANNQAMDHWEIYGPIGF